MALSETLLTLYKLEYQTTPITLDLLEQKYETKLPKEAQTWEKLNEAPTNPQPQKVKKAQRKSAKTPEPTSLEIDTEKALTLVPTEVVEVKDTPQTTDDPDNEIDTTIKEFKVIALQKALALLKEDTFNEMETRELKNLVIVVDTIDKARNKTPESTNVNVLVQNIVNKFIDDV